MKNDETFTLVTHKKTRGRKSLGNKDNKLQPVRTFPFTERNSCQSTSTDKNKTLKLVQESVHEIKSSQLWKKLESILKENKKLTDPEIQRELICFGLGSLSSYISRNQLGLGLLIAKEFDIRISKYSDPCFTPQDIEVLLELGNQVVSENLEGKYSCNRNYVTVFYLPHCPKQLVNNLLWCNWNPETLKNVILITNSFETIIERNPLRHLEQSAGFIVKIQAYSSEVQLPEYEHSSDIFNDLSVITFEKLPETDSELWIQGEAPSYDKDELELIQNGIERL